VILIHKGKTSKNEVPLDAEKALDPKAFATYTNKTGAKAPEHVALGWTLVSTQQGEDGKRAKYQDNVFELMVGADEVDALIKALTVAKKRFKTVKIPE
jgi:hypothetical protein